MQLHIEGRAITVLHLMGEQYVTAMKKLRAKMEDAEQPVTVLDADLKLAADILEQAGYKRDEQARVESVDDKQLGIFTDASADAPPRMARVECLVCSRHFAVPVGDTIRSCPDCGTSHRVKADAEGILYHRRILVVAPPEILELIRRKQDANEKGEELPPKDAAELDAWLKANPDYVIEQALPGDRVADPAVPGSGNPLRFDCSAATLSGNECDGFDGFDTPGQSVCPKCGNKYVVEILNGIILQRPWRPEDDRPADESPDAAGGA